MSPTGPDIERIEPEQLASLFDVSENHDPLWRKDELAAVFKHQMGAPVFYDLGKLRGYASTKLKQAATSPELLLRSFQELLLHPDPPLDLLELMKHFAKAHRKRPDGSLPVEVATALYYASIAAALVHCNKRISKLADNELRSGFAWCREQTWIDESIQPLFEQALAKISG